MKRVHFTECTYRAISLGWTDLKWDYTGDQIHRAGLLDIRSTGQWKKVCVCVLGGDVVSWVARWNLCSSFWLNTTGFLRDKKIFFTVSNSQWTWRKWDHGQSTVNYITLPKQRYVIHSLPAPSVLCRVRAHHVYPSTNGTSHKCVPFSFFLGASDGT